MASSVSKHGGCELGMDGLRSLLLALVQPAVMAMQVISSFLI